MANLLIKDYRSVQGFVDSQVGDEAALDAFSASLTGLDASWDTPVSLDGGSTPTGITTSDDTGEWRVTSFDIKNMGIEGSIDVPEVENLKQMTLFCTYLNNLDTNIPSELTNCTALKYCYLSGSNHTAALETDYPHILSQTGIKQVHVGKTSGDEQNVIRGAIPTGFGSMPNLEWFMLNWTDDWPLNGGESPTTVNGIESVPDDIFDSSTLVFLSIYENWNIAASNNQRSLPSTISGMTQLEHLYTGGGSGTHFDEDTQGWLTGSWPDVSNWTNMVALQMHKQGGLSGFPDLRNCTGMQTFHLMFSDMQGGDFPAWVVDGTLPEADTFDFSHPTGQGFTGTLPAFGSLNFMDLFNVTRHDMTGSIPADFWSLRGGFPPTKSNFGQNNYTSIGTTDFTSFGGGTFYIRVYDNEIRGEQIPNQDWSNPPTMGWVRFENNRYVFRDFLYVPTNAPAGETALELYKSIGINNFSYTPQKAFGFSANYNRSVGGSITLNDFDAHVSHTDNTYQWQKDGVNISGATSRSLSLSNLQTSDSGTYTLVVDNPGMTELTLTSEPLELTVS